MAKINGTDEEVQNRWEDEKLWPMISRLRDSNAV
jgi:hypothetical protein